MAEPHASGGRTLHGLTIQLTEDQRQAIAKFWKEHGSIGTAEIKIDVVNDKISPASIQVGTAK
jgi:hypothetical protein